jgi:hypothetical protein
LILIILSSFWHIEFIFTFSLWSTSFSISSWNSSGFENNAKSVKIVYK